jgi:ribosomal protein S18 acetylase RimI-like enzyme
VTETQPLSARVTAPDDAIPASGNRIVWRPATLADLDAIMDCEHAMNAVDHPHYLTNREEVEEEFSHSWVDLERDSAVALDESGAVVAWGLVMLGQGQETAVRAILTGGVRPSHRGQGLGRQLLAWQEARALGQLATVDKALPGAILVWADERQSDLRSLSARRGFHIARYYLELRRDLTQPIEPRELDGYEIVPFDLALAEQVRLARNDSFRDHWGSQPVVEEAWESFVARSILRPDLSFLAIAPDGEVAGFVISEVDEGDFESQGFTSAYIDLVGARRAHRGKGIAPALLTRTLEAIAAAGLEKAVLDVDSESLTGATRMYEAIGFEPANRSVELRKEI